MGNTLTYRNGVVFNKFAQHSDLLYLTGFAEADAAAILTKNEFTLFITPSDSTVTQWEGNTCSTETGSFFYQICRYFDLDSQQKLNHTLEQIK